MSIAELKENIHKKVDEINDEEVLESYLQMMNSDIDFWDELTEQQKQNVLEAKKQCENGETISHEDALKEISKWIIK
jgi:predicted transcriptional regulator